MTRATILYRREGMILKARYTRNLATYWIEQPDGSRLVFTNRDAAISYMHANA